MSFDPRWTQGNQLIYVGDQVDLILERLESLMASGAEVKVNVQQLRDDTDAMAAAYAKAWDYATSVNAAKDAAIADLKAKVAAGEALNAESFAVYDEVNEDAVAADATVKAVTAQLNSIGASSADPLPTPDPIPPAPDPVEAPPA